jgi:hypothetical protein
MVGVAAGAGHMGMPLPSALSVRLRTVRRLASPRPAAVEPAASRRVIGVSHPTASGKQRIAAMPDSSIGHQDRREDALVGSPPLTTPGGGSHAVGTGPLARRRRTARRYARSPSIATIVLIVLGGHPGDLPDHAMIRARCNQR